MWPVLPIELLAAAVLDNKTMPVKPIEFGPRAPTPTKVAREPAPITFAPAPPSKSMEEAKLKDQQDRIKVAQAENARDEARARAQAIIDAQLKEAQMWSDMHRPIGARPIPPKPELEFQINPITFQLEAMPVDPHAKAARKAAEMLRASPVVFDTPPVTKPVAHVPQAAFGVKEHPAYAQIIAKIKSDHSKIYAANQSKINSGVSSLLPLKVESVIDWGQKAMERVRDTSNEATRMTRMFADAEGSELCEKALEATRASGAARFFRVAADPLKLLPQLAVLQTSLTSWLPQCNTMIENAKTVHAKLMSLLVVMNVTADVVGTPDDIDIDRVLSQRRTMITHSTMQAELTVKQLEQLRDQIINQRMQIDQLVNVTLPAYEAAKR